MNLRPFGPEPNALPNCATPRHARENGANKGTRTLDLRFTKPLLYQLSYIGASAVNIITNGLWFVQRFLKKSTGGKYRKARYSIGAEELAVFNGSCLSEEDKQAVRNRMSRFAQFQNSQIIQKSLGHYAIERRKIKLNMLTPQEWLDIFIDRVNELRIKNEYPANVDIEDVNTPKCYFAFLVENISEDKIELSNDEPLVNGLLYLIYIKGYKDIAYIAKEILILNYIIDHMADAVMSSDSEVALNTAIEKAVDFIDVVFTSKFRCKTYSDVELKSKFKQILKDKELCDKVCKISPNKFDGGFNLVLVYNIIGLFRDIKLINGGISTIATAIAVSRNQINEKGKPQIRKEYISNWNIEIGEHKQTELSKNLIKRLEAIYL